MATIQLDNEKAGMALRSSLSLTSYGDKPFTVTLYEDTDDPLVLRVPRPFVNGSGVKVTGKWGEIRGKSRIKGYREGQEEAVQGFLSALKTNSPYGGIIKAPTSSGKTVMAIDIAYELGLKTLVIVPRTKLVAQWIERVKEFSTLKDKDIGVIQGSKCQVSGKSVVIAMLHSLSQKDYPEHIYKEFGLVIYDEVHLLGAETFSRTAPMFHCKYRLGLSATPRRKDGMEKVFRYHLGEVVHTIKKDKQPTAIRMIPYTGEGAHDRGYTWAGNFNSARYFNKLARLDGRNEMLADIVLRLYSKGEEIMLLSDRIDMLVNVDMYLRHKGVPGVNIGWLMGKKKVLDRPIILATYGTAGLGMDLPNLTALVFATPRTDIEQAVGRLRDRDDGRVPIVVDVVDTASPIMLGWARKREKYYQTLKGDFKKFY